MTRRRLETRSPDPQMRLDLGGDSKPEENLSVRPEQDEGQDEIPKPALEIGARVPQPNVAELYPPDDPHASLGGGLRERRKKF